MCNFENKPKLGENAACYWNSHSSWIPLWYTLITSSRGRTASLGAVLCADEALRASPAHLWGEMMPNPKGYFNSWCAVTLMGCRIGCRKVHSLLLVHIYYLTTPSLMVFLQVYLSDWPFYCFVCRENISIWGDGFVPNTVARQSAPVACWHKQWEAVLITSLLVQCRLRIDLSIKQYKFPCMYFVFFFPAVISFSPLLSCMEIMS